jgi:hypothetical protein
MMTGDYVTEHSCHGGIRTVLGNSLYKCDNARLQLKKSKRITVRHFYSLVPMSVVLSPKATPQESSPGAPKVFR